MPPTNNTDPYNPIFYAQEALMLLENALGMAGRVYRGYDTERKSANVGDTIRIKKPGTFTTQAGGTGTAMNLTPSYIDLTVDTWREVKFSLTDQELAKTGPQIISDHISPATYAIANYIETTLTGLYTSVPWSYDIGPGGATVDIGDIVDCRKVLRDNAGGLIDTDLTYYAIDSTMEAAFLANTVFHSASVAGSDSDMPRRRGYLGTRFGTELFVQQTLTNHTSGTIVSATNDVLGSIVGANAIRSTTISVENFAGGGGIETLVAGDSLVIAGNTQRYAVTATATMAAGLNTAVGIYPPLVAACTGGEVVTCETKSATNFSDRYFVNLMFHRNAFAIALAPLPEIGDGAGARMAVITDPRTGLSIRSRLAYDDTLATVLVTLDVLYGVKCLDPNLAVVARRNYA